MPFVLLIIGLVLVAAAVNDTVTDNSKAGQKGLTTLVKGDFTGENNYVYWMVSILVIGAIGYIDSLKNFSRVFMGLIVVVLFLKGGTGFFSKFQAFLVGLTPSGSAGFASGSVAGGVLANLLNPTAATSTTPFTVSNQPISLGGLPATFSGPSNTDLNAMGIETPLASGRLIP